MAEYLGHAVQRVAKTPTLKEIAEARALAAEANAWAGRIAAMLLSTLARFNTTSACPLKTRRVAYITII